MIYGAGACARLVVDFDSSAARSPRPLRLLRRVDAPQDALVVHLQLVSSAAALR